MAIGALALAGGARELIGESLAGATVVNDIGSVPPASTPSFHSRPDLRIPTLAVDVDRGGTAPGLIFIAPYGAPHGQAGAVVVDGSGEPVWEHPADLEIANFTVQSYMNRPVLTWWQGKIEYGHGVGSYLIASDSYEAITHVQAGNGLQGDLHEFLLTSRGTALLTSYVITHADLRAVGGSRSGTVQDAIFQEVDVATGRVLLEWRSLDHIALSESYWPLGENWDYVHLNSIDVDTDENLLVSSRNTHTVYKIGRRSGEVIWRLGGKHSDFALGPGAAFAWQHDVRRQSADRLTIFDNEGSPFAAGAQSRAIILLVDEQRKTARLQHEYRHPTPLAAASKGSVQLLPNGNVFVGWGAEPFVSEFAPAGELLLDARIGASYVFYRAFRMPWTGYAPGTPAVAAERVGNATSVFVSWNGDTRVTRWIALAGADAESLTPVASVARAGFETVLRLPSKFRHLRVRGTDATGAVLTTSGLLVI